MITRLDVGMDSRLCVQLLVDNPVAGRKGSLELRRYYKWYRETSSKFKGLGAVELESGKWLMWPCPAKVVESHGSELSFLEGGGGLAGLLMTAEEGSKVGRAVLWEDNIGAVWRQ